MDGSAIQVRSEGCITVRVRLCDFGYGNVGSLSAALREVGFQSLEIVSEVDPSDTSLLVLPGVGDFSHAMRKLGERRASALRTAVERKTPLIGICLGMQLLFDHSSESGGADGLGIINGAVDQIGFTNQRLPHVGWNSVDFTAESSLGEGLPVSADFYFTHSYFCRPESSSDVLGVTEYGSKFCSAVHHDNVVGLQFHPEKSGANGLKVLRNLADWSYQYGA